MKKRNVYLIEGAVLLILLLIWAFTPPATVSHGSNRIIAAPQEIVWSVISDVANYHHYAEGLTDVRILSGKGEGMIRACSDENATWTETCTNWTDGESYEFDVNVKDGFPFPFKHFSGIWMVVPVEDESCKLTIDFTYQFDYRWMKWFLNGATRAAIDAGNEQLMDNWEEEILKNAQTLSFR